MPELVQQAIKALKINVPVYRYETKGQTVRLWLYGRSEPVTWTKKTTKAKK